MDDWKKKSVDEKLNDIMDEIGHNSLGISSIDHEMENIKSSIDDLEETIKKLMNEVSSLKQDIQRLR